MNKKNKRQLNVRNKLMAAIAMLLVSSIMMVSTTYAWFTLSTAPEVQGITTTVGANGNLEIALAPYSGLGTDVEESAVGTSTEEWIVKNLTWGNLLDLSDEEYGLDELTLLPAQLSADASATANGGAGGYAVKTAPLATPVYGVDGRISSLTANTILGGKKATTTENGDGTTTTTMSDGYYADGGNGIRAVGTALAMSERELAFTSNLSGIKSNSSLANKSASTSLNTNGAALANIMVLHAQAGSGDANDYSEYVDELQTLTSELSTSANYIGESLRSTLLAAVAIAVADETEFKTAKSAIESATLADLFAAGGTYEGYYDDIPGFSQAVADWKAIGTKVSSAQSAADGLDASNTVLWDDVYTVLQYLMNTTGDVTISGKTITEIKENMNDYNFLLGLAKDCKIVLGAGSGVYYDISQMTGTINSAMTAVIPYNGSNIELDASIVTPEATGTLNVLYTAANAAGNADGVDFGSGDAVINVFYGYVVDFMFRTNVAGSHLKLQTEGAQRIYSDGTNAETMGNGSTITFTLDDASEEESGTGTEGSTESKISANTIKGLVEAVNVVFFDPDTLEIYGIAKVTTTSVDTLESGKQAVVGNLELWSYTVDENGYVELDEANTLTDEAATKICSLDQNTAKAVSAMVFLDGNNVSNADVLNDKKIEGTLNLQFSSSATLVPMENSALKNAAETTADETP